MEWLGQNQDNVSEWGDMSTRRLLFQWASAIKIHFFLLQKGTGKWTAISALEYGVPVSLIGLYSWMHVATVEWRYSSTVVWVRVMMFNVTFNSISVISWWSVLLVEETGVPRENHRPAKSYWQTLSQMLYLVQGSKSQLLWW